MREWNYQTTVDSVRRRKYPPSGHWRGNRISHWQDSIRTKGHDIDVMATVGEVFTYKDQGQVYRASKGNYTFMIVIKWKYFPRYWPFMRGIHRSPVNSAHKGQGRGALMFPLICAWINAWIYNGDLRRHRASYDVIVMTRYQPEQILNIGDLINTGWLKDKVNNFTWHSAGTARTIKIHMISTNFLQL